MTQEDKFFLIGKIEEIQKNIRYVQSNQETYVFQDFDEANEKPDCQMQPASRYGTAEGDDDYGVEEDPVVSQRSPKMSDKKSPTLPRRKSSFADN